MRLRGAGVRCLPGLLSGAWLRRLSAACCPLQGQSTAGVRSPTPDVQRRRTRGLTEIEGAAVRIPGQRLAQLGHVTVVQPRLAAQIAPAQRCQRGIVRRQQTSGVGNAQRCQLPHLLRADGGKPSETRTTLHSSRAGMSAAALASLRQARAWPSIGELSREGELT